MGHITKRTKLNTKPSIPIVVKCIWCMKPMRLLPNVLGSIGNEIELLADPRHVCKPEEE